MLIEISKLGLAQTKGGGVHPPVGFIFVVVENPDNTNETLIETDDDGLMYIEEAA